MLVYCKLKFVETFVTQPCDIAVALSKHFPSRYGSVFSGTISLLNSCLEILSLAPISNHVRYTIKRLWASKSVELHDISSFVTKDNSPGRAIAQAVSRRLPTAAARVQTRVWSCGIF
jgi:hypothetical protein